MTKKNSFYLYLVVIDFDIFVFLQISFKLIIDKFRLVTDRTCFVVWYSCDVSVKSSTWRRRRE